MAKTFKKNVIAVYNFNAQQAKVSGVFIISEVKVLGDFFIFNNHARASKWQLEGR